MELKHLPRDEDEEDLRRVADVYLIVGFDLDQTEMMSDRLLETVNEIKDPAAREFVEAVIERTRNGG